MRTILAILLLASSPAAAQMTDIGCNALSASAEDASARLDEMADKMKGGAFIEAMPHMPQKTKAAAADVEDARIAAVMALREYTHSLKDFSEAIRNCGQ